MAVLPPLSTWPSKDGPCGPSPRGRTGRSRPDGPGRSPSVGWARRRCCCARVSPRASNAPKTHSGWWPRASGEKHHGHLRFSSLWASSTFTHSMSDRHRIRFAWIGATRASHATGSPCSTRVSCGGCQPVGGGVAARMPRTRSANVTVPLPVITPPPCAGGSAAPSSRGRRRVSWRFWPSGGSP